MSETHLSPEEIACALEDTEQAIKDLLPRSPRRAARLHLECLDVRTEHRAARLTDRELTAALDELRAQANSAMTAP